MDKFFNWKDFDVEQKNPSEEALRRWRSAASIVKNRRRRFRMVADLDKRSEAEKKKLEIKVLSLLPNYVIIFYLILVFSSVFPSKKYKLLLTFKGQLYS